MSLIRVTCLQIVHYFVNVGKCNNGSLFDFNNQVSKSSVSKFFLLSTLNYYICRKYLLSVILYLVKWRNFFLFPKKSPENYGIRLLLFVIFVLKMSRNTVNITFHIIQYTEKWTEVGNYNYNYNYINYKD